VGTARTSLVAWLAARQQGGTLVMRLEDLDPPRVVAGAAQRIMDDLRWLGLDWDEGPSQGGAHGPYVQSQRLSRYRSALAKLQSAGLLYPCSCSRREVAALATAPHGELGPRYAGTCRDGPTRPGRPLAQRFRMPSVAGSFVDRVHGPIVGVADDDFVVRRADGLFAYQLAVVVDDIAMGITEVVRGDDLLSSTPRQLQLHAALGASQPTFVHVPLVLGDDNKRLSKRDGAIAVSDYRAAGWSPERFVGMLAASLGLCEDDSSCSPADLLASFSVEDLPRLPTQLRIFP